MIPAGIVLGSPWCRLPLFRSTLYVVLVYPDFTTVTVFFDAIRRSSLYIDFTTVTVFFDAIRRSSLFRLHNSDSLLT